MCLVSTATRWATCATLTHAVSLDCSELRKEAPGKLANSCESVQAMQRDGPAMSDSGHLGQHPGSGPHRGRGRGWGRGGSGSGGLQPFRRGQAGLDPAVLERRRKSTAAIIARQLAHVHVSESLAGQKVPLHLVSFESNNL